MATLQNIGKLKYRGKDGLWHPLPVVVQDTGGGVSTISGKGAPTSETQGKVNQLYRDEDTQKLYICTSTDGGYTWTEVSGGGSVDVDATLTKAGQAADAKAAGDAIGKKIDKAQGTGNAGKILGIGADGNVTPQDKPVQALAGASAPTTATAGMVGQEYYVIANGEVTEMYVCTAVSNGTYTWGKVEFGAEESDPTVPAWAKAAQKPSYTASEVGADPSGTAASQVSAHNTGVDTHSDIRLLISGLTDRLNALADSDDTTLDQLSEVVAYIKSNRTLIESITTSKVNVADIIDNLTTNVANKPLSAAQGVALKALIDGIVIPDALPNPNALTFTGAVTGSYDGSAPLEVAIPSGGGGSGDSEWEYLGEFTETSQPTFESGKYRFFYAEAFYTKESYAPNAYDYLCVDGYLYGRYSITNTASQKMRVLIIHGHASIMHNTSGGEYPNRTMRGNATMNNSDTNELSTGTAFFATLDATNYPISTFGIKLWGAK